MKGIAVTFFGIEVHGRATDRDEAFASKCRGNVLPAALLLLQKDVLKAVRKGLTQNRWCPKNHCSNQKLGHGRARFLD